MLDFTTAIRARRLKKGYSQKELAEILNVAQQHISRWESGERKPDVESLYRLSLALDCSMEDLFILNE